MTDLVDEVRTSFEKTREAAGEGGPVQVVRAADELGPGFLGMQAHYRDQLLIITRRGYRQFAGSTFSGDIDDLVERTTEVMLEAVIGVLLEAFADGVLIGQREMPMVKVGHHFGRLDHLFEDEDFRLASINMATGFMLDPEVAQFFIEYVRAGLVHLTHLTGLAHTNAHPQKVWDIWLMVGNAVTSVGYLAGQQLGQIWAERDVLDGIEIATEEGPDESR